jgi:CHAT domain-containing protein
MAGAEHLLATLRIIDDAATVTLMKDFYTDYVRNGNTPAALSNAKRKHLPKHLKKTGSYHHAVFLSGPFILSR